MDALYCAFCLIVRKHDLSRAVTICNGQACCFDHLYYVQGGEYNRILAVIKKDEKKPEAPADDVKIPNVQTDLKHGIGRYFRR